jgi:hypothetical protein
MPLLLMMHGIGGTKISIEQQESGMTIGTFQPGHFTLQLVDVRDMHGFNGIIGSDVFWQIN